MKAIPLHIRITHFFIRLWFGFLSKIFPALATRFAYNMFFKPQFYAIPQKERDAYKNSRTRTLSHGDKEVLVYEWGEGDRIVLFHHGWNGRGTQVAHFLPQLLERGFRVVAFDGPAHGQSTGKRTNLIEFSEVLKKLVEPHGEIEAIIAHSFGGMVSSYSMQTHNIKVKKMVSIAAPYDMESILEGYGKIINVGSHILERFKARLEREFDMHWSEISGDFIVSQHTIPALIIHDKQDKDVLYEEAVAMNKNWKNSRLLTTDGLGHRRILKDNAIIEETVSFISQPT